MRYHETLPSEPGEYYSMSRTGENPCLRDGVWFAGDQQLNQLQAAAYRPVLGPLPESPDAALALACEVAFARMWLAWRKRVLEYDGHDLKCVRCCDRFDSGERTLSLLRDMERVTSELTK